MTDFTPEQARKLADDMELGRPVYNIADALRSLANQVEALTAENANILRASLYSADIATQAMEDVKTLTAERDALKADAARYRWLRDRFLGADFNWNEMGKQVLMIEWPGGSVNGDLDTTLATAMKEPK